MVMADMLTEAKVAYVKLRDAPSTVESETRDLIMEAQVAATLAVAEELSKLREALPAALRGALLEALGDDSHLDKLVGVLRDLPIMVEQGIADGLLGRGRR
jgi:hypothetical protein